ncbi:MAG: glycosyltransferase family 2 protein, partial [Solirubrobacteraceae bacterium]|nr:glycosyltransferase family 2 protein [Solirubrobacteraceae bacterium]
MIPAFNRAALVERALRSVAAQRGPRPAQVLVVDDASSDDTAAVARAMGAEVVVHPENRGEGAARNSGLAAADHDWVALLDSDDEWLPDHLAGVWAARGTHVLVADTCIVHGGGPEEGRIYGWPGAAPRTLRTPAEIAWPENIVNPSAALVRRDALLHAGGFPVGVPRAGDLDTWLRLLEQGTGLVLGRIGVAYHLHPEQVSSDRSRMRDAHIDVVERYRDRPWHDPRTARRLRGVAAWDQRTPRGFAALLDPRAAEGLVRTLA